MVGPAARLVNSRATGPTSGVTHTEEVVADLHQGDNALIVVVTLGAGLAPALSDGFYDAFPAWAQIVLGSGISTGCLLAVALNLVFNHLGAKASSAEREPDEPVPASAPAEGSVVVGVGCRAGIRRHPCRGMLMSNTCQTGAVRRC
ncbi:hypothetical protein ACFQ0X_10105 [Streptomyces rectiviolaceus]|uniref:Uncharacterized protein n=1 Tax=Streptomyces rectiviolaceus TaxID=332591 RepID=A0ABP6MEE3_9ACTN